MEMKNMMTKRKSLSSILKVKKNNQALFFREIDDHTHLDLLGNNMTVACVAPARKFCFCTLKITKFS